MLLLIDEDVPVSVAEFLRSREHEVRFVRDELAAGASDPTIAAYGNGIGAIVVTCNHRHFKALSPHFSKGSLLRLPQLGRVSLACNQTSARRRIEEVIDWIEYEYAQCQQRTDRRLLITVRENDFVVER